MSFFNRGLRLRRIEALSDGGFAIVVRFVIYFLTTPLFFIVPHCGGARRAPPQCGKSCAPPRTEAFRPRLRSRPAPDKPGAGDRIALGGIHLLSSIMALAQNHRSEISPKPAVRAGFFLMAGRDAHAV